MSESDVVDDLLEAPFGKEDAKAEDVSANRPAARKSQDSPNATSPEPANGTDRKSDTSDSRRRRASPSRSRSRTPKRKSKRRSRSRSTSRRRRSDSRSRKNRRSQRKRTPSDSDSSERERERRRKKKRSPTKSPSTSSRSRSRERKRKSVSRDRKRSVSRDRKRSVSPAPRRDRDRRRRDSRSRSRSESPRRSPPRRRSRSRSPFRRGGGGGRGYGYGGFRDRGGYGGGYRNGGGYGGGGYGFGRGGGGGGGRNRQSIERARSVRSESPNLPPEERDQRTVFAMQLAQTINAKDLEKFFSSVGKVRDVRLIVDSKTRRSKGIAYIEFRELEAVPLALGLHGQKLKNCPMNIQPTHAEKNRAALAAAGAVQKGPMRLYVGSLHFNITEDMLKDIFEPFGKIDSLQLMMDTETQRSRGYAFITFRDAQDAKRAMEQLNGFELAGRAMKIGHVTDRSENGGQGSLDVDDMDRPGFDLGPTGRLQLMAKLAEGTGLKIPQQAQQTPTPAASPAAPIATQCFMLSNMFDPKTETDPDWDQELAQEIVDECSQYGGVVHVSVDKNSPEGLVYVKSVSISAAALAVQHLHGRYFAGRMITANYIPPMNYHQLFKESLKAVTPLPPSTA
ncbi:hypothetical protein RvY_07933 [Ramazzottius varieornatus]|uniref:RRM domain-containing protein n=1 Tax=Ramazzottius varieornatus TaxID=947166 RepID=A0A1D1VDB9_RAMVA|nr:hypothetical protein RvY_07933 [Ramazzottius varieornatus]